MATLELSPSTADARAVISQRLATSSQAIYRTRKAPKDVLVVKEGSRRTTVGRGTTGIPVGSRVFDRGSGREGVVIGTFKQGALGDTRLLVLFSVKGTIPGDFKPRDLDVIERPAGFTKPRGFASRALGSKRLQGFAGSAASLGSSAFLGVSLPGEPSRKPRAKKTAAKKTTAKKKPVTRAPRPRGFRTRQMGR